MPSTRDTYVARQPILDKGHRIVGYELLFRASDGRGLHAVDASRATVEVVLDTFANGAVDIAGPLLAFINVTPEILFDGVLDALPAKKVVFELPAMDIVFPEFERLCRELAKAGTRLALQGFGRRDARDCLLPYAKYVKCDVAATRPSDLRQLVRKVKRTRAKIVAERVETQEDHARCLAAGSDLFQGYYFARPVLVAGRRVDPEQGVLMDLLTKIGQGCDFDEIVAVFKRNASLNVNLLRLVNSGTLARATRIKSVSEALVLIGSRQLVRWLTLLLYTGESDGMQDALMKTAAKRGRVLETLYKEVPGGVSQVAGPEVAFLVGMLSKMDALFGVPMAEVIEQVSVDPIVRETLLERTGALGGLLRLEEALEALAFEDVAALAEELGVEPARLAEVEHEAFTWVHGSETPKLGT